MKEFSIDNYDLVNLDDTTHQLRELSSKEIELVSGGVGPIVVGAIMGAGGYIYKNGSESTLTGIVAAAGIGAVTGGVQGALIKAAGGGLIGNIAWRPGMAGINYGAQQVGSAYTSGDDYADGAGHAYC